MLDAVIYMLEFHEFNAASRRAFNQQQVLFDCIKEELQRSNPLLHAVFSARLRGGADADENQVEVIISDLTPPWTSAALLKRHLLSDPTAKSRDKFVGILESLFDHPALTQCGDDLRTAFTQVVTKIVYGFSVASMNRVGGSRTSSPSYDALSEMSSNDSGSSLLRVSSTVNAHISAISLDPAAESSAKRARRSAADTCTARPLPWTSAASRAPTPTPALAAAGPASDSVDSSPPIAALHTARYATRSSTDGFRTGITTVNGTTYRCRYMIGPRRITQTAGGSIDGDTTLPPAPDSEYPAPAEDATGKLCDYHFDPAVFDDPASSEGDTQPWEYLDDWAWEGGRNLAPFPVFTAPLGRPIVLRPPQCFPSLPRAESMQAGPPTLYQEPRHIPDAAPSPPLAGMTPQDGRVQDGEWGEAKGEEGSGQEVAPALTFWQSSRSFHHARGVYAANAVPFPDHSVHSLYSRRSAFRPVPPESQTSGDAGCMQAPVESERSLHEAVQNAAEEASVEMAGQVRGSVESASLPVQEEAVHM
jgi:hypothetical protein